MSLPVFLIDGLHMAGAPRSFDPAYAPCGFAWPCPPRLGNFSHGVLAPAYFLVFYPILPSVQQLCGLGTAACGWRSLMPLALAFGVAPWLLALIRYDILYIAVLICCLYCCCARSLHCMCGGAVLTSPAIYHRVHLLPLPSLPLCRCRRPPLPCCRALQLRSLLSHSHLGTSYCTSSQMSLSCPAALLPHTPAPSFVGPWPTPSAALLVKLRPWATLW
jgi:hypothetical protein